LVGRGNLFLNIFRFLEAANITYRFQSITQEPSFIAFVFAPIIFVSLYGLLTGRFSLIGRAWSILFIMGYLLTVSFIAYIGVALMLTLITMRSLTPLRILIAFFSVVAIFALGVLAYYNIEAIRMRVDDTIMGASQNIISQSAYLNVNLSSYAFLTNAYVVKQTLADHFFVGTGLGTHQLNYDHYMPPALRDYITLNREEANSMGLRLLSETGVIGLSVFILFVFSYKAKFRDSFTEQQVHWWMINCGTFVMIILFLMRNGHYTIHGRILFLLLYYYTYLFIKDPARYNSKLQTREGDECI